MISRQTVQCPMRGEYVSKVINTVQYLRNNISKVGFRRDLDINGNRRKISQLCSVWSLTRGYY